MSSKKRSSSKNQVVSPKLTVDGIIEYCKNDLGITFNMISEEKAKDFLQRNNYFFRLKQYAATWNERDRKGKFIGLDFGHLIELSTIDMFFRKLTFKMTIDLEHFLKVKLVNDCQNNEKDDGYEVVQAFLKNPHNSKIAYEIQNTKCLTEYGGYDSERYRNHPSVWNMCEMLGFSDFTRFFSFYYDYFFQKKIYQKQLHCIRQLRNASAHNTCILCNFNPFQGFNIDIETCFDLENKQKVFNSEALSQIMRVPVLNDFAVLLNLYTKLCTSQKVKEKTLEELSDFFDGRMLLHKDYFKDCTAVKRAYKFARECIKAYGGK